MKRIKGEYEAILTINFDVPWDSEMKSIDEIKNKFYDDLDNAITTEIKEWITSEEDIVSIKRTKGELYEVDE